MNLLTGSEKVLPAITRSAVAISNRVSYAYPVTGLVRTTGLEVAIS